MKILEKIFHALIIISMVSVGVGTVIFLWFNALIGLKVVGTSFVCMLVGFSLDIYQ